MWMQMGVVLAYLLAMLAVGLVFRRRASTNRLEFFLAGRGVGRLLLFFTMAATNFSAFTIFGLSGAGYRIGYAFYPIMGFGTGFMAVSFWLIGRPILLLAAERGYVTPADFVSDRYGAPWLKLLFSAVMIVFTLPYIALQAIAAGRSLQSMVGLPYLAGAALITAFVVLYVSLGGLRSVAWTDLIQALMMVGLTLTAYVIIVRASGASRSFTGTHQEAFAAFPALFSRPGLDGSMLPGVWLGYLLLWFFADPMFPQLFQRFLAAKNPRALRTTTILYPLITTALFFLTVSIGVLGRLSFPALPAAQSDTIFPLLLARFTGPLAGTVLLLGGLAALMSTMDSQLLTTTSMISEDFLALDQKAVWGRRLIAVLLGLGGLLLASPPPQTILDFINKTTFNGLSVLAPTVIGGLYWRRANRYGVASSILVGEALVMAFGVGWLRLPRLLPVVPIVAAAAASLVAVSLATSRTLTRSHPGSGENPSLVRPVPRRAWLPAAAFSVLFLLGNDFWAWGRVPRLFAGLPLWVWYYAALGVVLAGTYALLWREPAKG
jgi:SSS family solute:Na+ symporter